MRYESRAWILSLVALIAYAGLAVGWVYGVLNTERGDESIHSFWNSLPALLLVLAIVVAAGFFVRRWWALALAFLPAVLAVPAGAEPDGYPEVPIWLYLTVQGIALVPFVAAGLGLRYLFDRATRGALESPRAPETHPRPVSRRQARRR